MQGRVMGVSWRMEDGEVNVAVHPSDEQQKQDASNNQYADDEVEDSVSVLKCSHLQIQKSKQADVEKKTIEEADKEIDTQQLIDIFDDNIIGFEFNSNECEHLHYCQTANYDEGGAEVLKK